MVASPLIGYHFQKLGLSQAHAVKTSVAEFRAIQDRAAPGRRFHGSGGEIGIGQVRSCKVAAFDIRISKRRSSQAGVTKRPGESAFREIRSVQNLPRQIDAAARNHIQIQFRADERSLARRVAREKLFARFGWMVRHLRTSRFMNATMPASPGKTVPDLRLKPG